jgi:plastocyanin
MLACFGAVLAAFNWSGAKVADPTTSPATAPSAPAADVSIDNFTYSPASFTAKVGQTVTWVNHDEVPHTVTASDHSFTSTGLDTDERYSRTFTAPGTYPYFCAIHPHMTGEIVVTAN